MTRARYTAAELLEAYLLDLEVDARCADRDGLPDYAARCRAEAEALRAAPEVRISRYGIPVPAGDGDRAKVPAAPADTSGHDCEGDHDGHHETDRGAGPDDQGQRDPG